MVTKVTDITITTKDTALHDCRVEIRYSKILSSSDSNCVKEVIFQTFSGRYFHKQGLL